MLIGLPRRLGEDTSPYLPGDVGGGLRLLVRGLGFWRVSYASWLTEPGYNTALWRVADTSVRARLSRSFLANNGQLLQATANHRKQGSWRVGCFDLFFRSIW